MHYHTAFVGNKKQLHSYLSFSHSSLQRYTISCTSLTCNDFRLSDSVFSPTGCSYYKRSCLCMQVYMMMRTCVRSLATKQNLRRVGKNSGPILNRLCTRVHEILLLGRVALGAQRPIVVKLSRERSVGRSVCPSFQCIVD